MLGYFQYSFGLHVVNLLLAEEEEREAGLVGAPLRWMSVDGRLNSPADRPTYRANQEIHSGESHGRENRMLENLVVQRTTHGRSTDDSHE